MEAVPAAIRAAPARRSALPAGKTDNSKKRGAV
jgi:hypothetical protein